jgi:3'-phosphoadenosine 5'-phosphosulfate sulfotransferase (PAPS reductase)/FAD synthetase
MTAISLPTEVDQALRSGAALAISISGGKDSEALLHRLVREHAQRAEWTGPVFAVHADLGRAEWPQTEDLVAELAARYEIDLHVVRRVKGDLVERWEARAEQLDGTGKPFWSSSASRYCTSDLKRDPIDKLLRQYDHVVSAEGIRAEESRARAAKPCFEPRKRIITKSRQALTWRPIHEWTEAEVWVEIGTSLQELNRRRWLYRAGLEDEALAGWIHHPAYVFGNERLSCALCVLASKNDLRNGARHHPELYRHLVELETRYDCSFRNDLWLRDLFNTPEVTDA